MRLFVPAVAVLLSSCAARDQASDPPSHPPLAPPPADRVAKPAAPPAPTGDPLPEPAPPAGPQHAPRLTRTDSGGSRLTLLSFDDRSHTLVVLDKPSGPGSAWTSSKEAATSHRALAAINGGFFTPEGAPLGLVIAGGTRRGSWTRQSSLTSGVLAVHRGKPRIVRSAAWSANRPAEQLVQSGPFLLENSRVVTGLSRENRRARSFVAWDGQHHWVLGHADSATLDGLARALAAQPVPKLTLRTALNLDGGRSADLWISSAVKGGPLSTRQLWNKPVRNYLLLVKGTPSPPR